MKMRLEDLYRYCHEKPSLEEVYRDASEVPDEYLMDWIKDKHDFQRFHTEEELISSLELTPE
ncbi:MAG: hypothetical protein JRJ29_20090, partial [Deltaproteobacteria bacterium]|nr:hypothetical protein [Deltaproteobacteria bacterium]